MHRYNNITDIIKPERDGITLTERQNAQDQYLTDIIIPKGVDICLTE